MKEIKYEYVPVGTTRPRNGYERLYIYTTNEINANKIITSTKKCHTW